MTNNPNYLKFLAQMSEHVFLFKQKQYFQNSQMKAFRIAHIPTLMKTRLKH